MRLRAVLLSILAFGPASLSAATEFPGGLVPMDIVREFAGGTLYKSLPDGFPPISLPPGLDLRLVGSTQENYSQKVVLRTTLSREAFNEQLSAASTAQGWLDVSSAPPLSQLRLCHDQYGTLYVSMNSSSAGSNRVDVHRSTFPTSQTCREQQAQAELSSGWTAFYNARFPTLAVPPEAISTTPSPYLLRSGSSSSSGGRVDMSRDGVIEVPGTNPASLHQYFAAQMQNQGWRMDSSASGERSGTSVWILSAAAPGLSNEPVEILVTLTVARGAGNIYAINVKFQSPPAADGGSGLFASFF